MSEIVVREVEFSNAPIGRLHVKEPFHADEQGNLIPDIWRDINYFQETHGLMLMQVVQIESGSRYGKPQLVGIFVDARPRFYTQGAQKP